MPDDQTAALQALIQQVTTLTEKVEAQDKKYADTYKLNAKLLAEQKGDGKSPDLPEHIQAILDAGTAAKDDPTKVDWAALNKAIEAKISNPDRGLENVRRAGDPVRISKTDALDPRKYDEAKRVATETGGALEIFDPDADVSTQAPASDNLYQPTEPVRIHRADAMNTVKYAQAKQQAEASGVALEIINDQAD